MPELTTDLDCICKSIEAYINNFKSLPLEAALLDYKFASDIEDATGELVIILKENVEEHEKNLPILY